MTVTKKKVTVETASFSITLDEDFTFAAGVRFQAVTSMRPIQIKPKPGLCILNLDACQAEGTGFMIRSTLKVEKYV